MTFDVSDNSIDIAFDLKQSDDAPVEIKTESVNFTTQTTVVTSDEICLTDCMRCSTASLFNGNKNR